MIKWEYLTKFIWAHLDNEGAEELIKQSWPKWNPPEYAPQTMIPELDAWGENGWELVHMEPVPKVGKNYDVGFVHSEAAGLGGITWSNVYFCVFKRPKQTEEEFENEQ
jgi:hypothetical protein